MRPTTILLARHGETAWNRSKVFRGTRDVPLNDNGRNQAKLLAEVLRGRSIRAVYTSPLSRARETADIALANHGIEPVVEKGLIDFDYGDWTGLEETEVARRWPQQYRLWSTQPERAQPPNGDTLGVVFDRAFAAMDALAKHHPGETIALFAHRVVNKLLILAALGLRPPQFPFIRQDNCCLNTFERRDDGYVIVAINNTSHIDATTDLLTADF